jgi:adenosylcobinamide hydrolase
VKAVGSEIVCDGELPVLLWRFAEPRLVTSSAPVGGGLGPRQWILNAQVAPGYTRTDLAAHIGVIATSIGLPAHEGVGMLTAAPVLDAVATDDEGVAVLATVGLGAPEWAAAPDPARVVDVGTVNIVAQLPVALSAAALLNAIGTINVVAQVPVALSPAALVNAIGTVTEAKAQALWDLGLAATGTATDAVAVVCPLDGGAEPFGGPRSVWGARLARAVHASVRAGGERWLRTWA